MTRNIKLLIISDRSSHIETASTIATNEGAKVFFVDNIDSALDHLRLAKGADLIICDVSKNISELINKLEQEHICISVIACGFESNTSAAVKAIKSGAKEYLPLPPDKELIAAILASISIQAQQDVLYKSKKMIDIIQTVKQVASSEATILITGESGTGKEIIARKIFELSNRNKQPYITLNCAAIPDNLMESELFGHEKGAFTGALSRRIGKFEEANNGTILLDEITEMDIRLQSKLLRVLQERTIERVGSNQSINLDVRVIATSNRDILEEIKNNNFRHDLYYRLNVINITLPPLRERKEDIEILADYFIKKYSKFNHLDEKFLSTDALKKLENYNWPGNVRELENIIHRAVLISPTQEITIDNIIVEDHENQPQDSNTNNMIGRTVESVEKELIINTIKYCLGNKTHAANVLGISIRTLRNKLKEYKETI